MLKTTIQVTNVSPSATTQQMKELFSYLGDIAEIKLYPEDDTRDNIPSKVCFVCFKDTSSCDTALHLSSTIFIDRALVVGRSRYAAIPDETTAMSLAAPAVAIANHVSSQPVGHAAPLLPTPPTGPLLATPPVVSLGAVAAAVAAALTPKGLVETSVGQHAASNLPLPAPQQLPLISLMGTVVPQPPPLTGNVDPTKIEEIRRTVYVGNLNSNLTAEQVLTFFQPCGEIKYVRMAGDETQPTRFAFVEFSSPNSVPIALQYNGAMFGDRPIKVNHSKNAIVKPQGKTAEVAQKEVEEAMRKAREAQQAIAKTLEPGDVPVEDGKGKSKTRSHSRSKSRERSRHSRSRSRSKGRGRNRSRSPKRRGSPSRSPVTRRKRRSRSRTPPPRRHLSRDRARKERHRRRSRSVSPRRRDVRPARRRRSTDRRPSKSPDKRSSKLSVSPEPVSPKKSKRGKTPEKRSSRSPEKRSSKQSASPEPISSKKSRRSKTPEKRTSRSPEKRSSKQSVSPSPISSKKSRRKSRKSEKSHSRSASPVERTKKSKKDKKHHKKVSRSPSPVASPVNKAAQKSSSSPPPAEAAVSSAESNQSPGNSGPE